MVRSPFCSLTRGQGVNDLYVFRLEVLRALVGHIPPNPLWAEVVWQKQEELRKQAAGTSETSRPAMPVSSTRPSQELLSRSQMR